MEKKPKGKYAPGYEPWAILGIKEGTWYPTIKREKERGLFNGPAHRALQRALDIVAGAIEPDPVEASAVAPAEPTSAVEAPVAPAEPEAVEAPVEAPRYSPAASLSAPSEPPPPAVSGATVFVSFRCPAAVHDRMREMAHQKRTKLQGIVGAAVEAYLSQNGF